MVGARAGTMLEPNVLTGKVENSARARWGSSGYLESGVSIASAKARLLNPSFMGINVHASTGSAKAIIGHECACFHGCRLEPEGTSTPANQNLDCWGDAGRCAMQWSSFVLRSARKTRAARRPFGQSGRGFCFFYSQEGTPGLRSGVPSHPNDRKGGARWGPRFGTCNVARHERAALLFYAQPRGAVPHK